ncbi:MAG: hypothetical protein Q9228_004844 [Teloschistes exilis]
MGKILTLLDTVHLDWVGSSDSGGGAYYAAKRSINADKQARHEEDMKRRQLAQSRASNTPEPTPKARRRKADHAGSPSTEASHDPAPIHHTADNGNTKAQEQNWLLKNTATSPAKTSAVGKFLVALASSFSTSDATGDHGHANKPSPSSRRQKLHILYLVHDLLHHAKFHATNFADSDSPNQGLRPYISQLVSVASAYDAEKYPRHFIKINELLSLWNKGKYFPASYLATLKEASTSTSKATTWSTGNVDDGEGSNARIEPTEIRKDAPYIMPPSHGDASDPYYDLPAGNLMSHIVPNSTTPIVPRAVKPLQFRAGPANEKLANIVKAFLQEADAVYGGKLPGNGVLGTDIDQLGQSITFNGPRGEPLIGEEAEIKPQFIPRMKRGRLDSREITVIPTFVEAVQGLRPGPFHLHDIEDEEARRPHSMIQGHIRGVARRRDHISGTNARETKLMQDLDHQDHGHHPDHTLLRIWAHRSVMRWGPGQAWSHGYLIMDPCQQHNHRQSCLRKAFWVPANFRSLRPDRSTTLDPGDIPEAIESFLD